MAATDREPQGSGDVRSACENRLTRMTAHLRSWSETIPELREATGGAAGIERIITRAEHVFLPFPTGDLHLEVHAADAADALTIILVPGTGSHARFHSAALGTFREHGIHAIGLDRPGHGLSGGRRGHAPIEATIDAIEHTGDFAQHRFGGKVALIGHSFGGVIAWYALTRQHPIADAVVCAGTIAHPEVLPTRQARLRAPVVRRLARLAPYRTLPIKKLAPFEHVALDPDMLRFFEHEDDDVWCWRYTLSSLASFLDFAPQRDWSLVNIQTLVLAGSANRMTDEASVRAVMRHSQPPGARLHVVPGAGEMVFHEHLLTTLQLLQPWLTARALEGQPSPDSPASALPPSASWLHPHV